MNESLDHLAKVCEQLRKKERTSYFAVMFIDPDWELCESARILARYIQTNGPEDKTTLHESGKLVTPHTMNQYIRGFYDNNMYTGVLFQEHYPWETDGLLVVKDADPQDVKCVIEKALGATYCDIDGPEHVVRCKRVWIQPCVYVSGWKVDPTTAINASDDIVRGFFDYARIITRDERPSLLAPLVSVMQKDYFYASRVAADSISPARAHYQAGATVDMYYSSAVRYFKNVVAAPSDADIMSVIHTLRKTFECHEDESCVKSTPVT